MTSKKSSNILENEERPNDIFGRFLLLKARRKKKNSIDEKNTTGKPDRKSKI
jgi:hypothetical protein